MIDPLTALCKVARAGAQVGIGGGEIGHHPDHTLILAPKAFAHSPVVILFPQPLDPVARCRATPAGPYTSLAAVIGYVSLGGAFAERWHRLPVVGVSNRYDIVGNGLVRIVQVVVRAVSRAVQPTINRQCTALENSERSLVEVGVRPVIVAGFEGHPGGIIFPAGACDKQTYAVEVAKKWHFIEGARVGQCRLRQRAPGASERFWPGGRFCQRVGGAVMVLNGKGGEVGNVPVEKSGVAQAHLRAIRACSIHGEIEEAADAGFGGKQVFAGGVSPHCRQLVYGLADADTDVFPTLMPAAIFSHDLPPHG